MDRNSQLSTQSVLLGKMPKQMQIKSYIKSYTLNKSTKKGKNDSFIQTRQIPNKTIIRAKILNLQNSNKQIMKSKIVNEGLPTLTNSKTLNNYEIRSKTPNNLKRELDFSFINRTQFNTINNGANNSISLNKKDLQIILSLKKQLKAKNEEIEEIIKQNKELNKKLKVSQFNELEIENEILKTEIQKMKEIAEEKYLDIAKENEQNMLYELNQQKKLIEGLRVQNQNLKKTAIDLTYKVQQTESENQEKELLEEKLTEEYQLEIKELSSKIEKLENIITGNSNTYENKVLSLQKKIFELNSELKKYKDKSLTDTSEKSLATTVETPISFEIGRVNLSSHSNKENGITREEVPETAEQIEFSKDFRVLHLVTEEQYENIKYLIIKILQAKNISPSDFYNEKMLDIHKISDFTSVISSQFSFTHEDDIVALNLFAFHLSVTDNHYLSIEQLNENLKKIFLNSDHISSSSHINFSEEFKENFITELISLCASDDVEKTGEIHFDVFNHLVSKYMNSNVLTKKGYDYMMYIMKKNAEKNLYLFNLDYKALDSLIETLAIAEEERNHRGNKVEEKKEANSLVNELFDTALSEKSARIPALNSLCEAEKITDEIFKEVLLERKMIRENYSNFDKIEERTKQLIDNVFHCVLNKLNKPYISDSD